MSRKKRSFWKSGSSVFEEVSHKTLLFEAVSQNSLVYKILMQVVHKDPDTEILRQRSCRSGPTGSLIEVVYRILMQRSCPYRILIQWSKGSWHKDPDTEILYKWSYRILIQVRSKRILIERSWDRDLVQVLLQEPDTSGPKGSWYRDKWWNSSGRHHLRGDLLHWETVWKIGKDSKDLRQWPGCLQHGRVAQMVSKVHFKIDMFVLWLKALSIFVLRGDARSTVIKLNTPYLATVKSIILVSSSEHDN